MTWLEPVAAALDAAPAPVDVFFGDDDAGWRDDRLLALLGVFEEHDVPPDVAVIPAALGEAAAAEVRARAGPRLGLHQHGFDHRNMSRRGASTSAGRAGRAPSTGATSSAGPSGSGTLLGDRVDLAIFTPPWNRCTEETGRCLLEIGFETLSRESRARPLELPGLPVHVDWCRLTPEDVAARLAAAIARPGPAGVMLHHAVMDAADRARAGELLALVAAHPRRPPAGHAGALTGSHRVT